MKKLYLFFVFLVVGFSAKAAPAVSADDFRHSYGDAFIFVEGGVEFAVFPDGQFDFFYNPRFRGSNFSISTPNVNISYNAGYNYDPFIQYDDFGAVVQIENVPVYYDFYGRIIQAGHVHISYNHFGMVHRIGNLYLHYNPYNRYTHYSGFINSRNPYYVYRPWHNYYMRPPAYASIVYYQPYRAYYYPNRMKYTHYRNYYKKHYDRDFRKHYYRPGDAVTSYHRGRRTEAPRQVRRPDSDISTGYYQESQSRDRSYSPSKRSSEKNKRTVRSRSSRAAVETPREVRSYDRNEQMSAPVERGNPVATEAVKRNERSAETSGTRTRSSRGRQ